MLRFLLMICQVGGCLRVLWRFIKQEVALAALPKAWCKVIKIWSDRACRAVILRDCTTICTHAKPSKVKNMQLSLLDALVLVGHLTQVANRLSQQ